MSVIYPLILHIGEDGHLNGFICIIVEEFLFLTPFQRHLCPFFDLYEAQEPNNYLRSASLVLFLLSIHSYCILVEVEHLKRFICIIIDDFPFLTPFSLIVVPFFIFMRPCNEIIT